MFFWKSENRAGGGAKLNISCAALDIAANVLLIHSRKKLIAPMFILCELAVRILDFMLCILQ